MSEFDNSGKIALWTNESDNDRAPDYKGHAYAHRDIKKGEKVAVALWENEPGDRRPALRGKMEDFRVKQAEQPAPPSDSAPFHDDLDSGIPF